MKNRILVVGADFGPTSDEAIRIGLEQIADSSAQGMYVVHVLATEPTPAEEHSLDAHTEQMVAASLALRVAQIAEREHIPYYEELVRIAVRKGEVQQALIDVASEHHAELLIVGTHGRRGLDRLLAGSVAETLVRRAPCSVLVARIPARKRPSTRAQLEHRDYAVEPSRLAR